MQFKFPAICWHSKQHSERKFSGNSKQPHEHPRNVHWISKQSVVIPGSTPKEKSMGAPDNSMTFQVKYQWNSKQSVDVPSSTPNIIFIGNSGSPMICWKKELKIQAVLWHSKKHPQRKAHGNCKQTHEVPITFYWNSRRSIDIPSSTPRDNSVVIPCNPRRFQ